MIEEVEYDANDIARHYRKSESGVYHITSGLSGIDTAKLIKEIIVNEHHQTHIRFWVTGSDGHADVIGMYCSQQFGIQLEFERIPHTRDFVIFFKRGRTY